MITMPKLDTVNAIGFIKKLHETEISSDMEVDFDFSPNWVEPYGLLLCGSAIKSFRKQSEWYSH